MIYVMSDMHGDFERYRKMLEKIKLKESDTLYVLGDVIDRGESGMKILLDMMLRPNVIPILGNHEYMAATCMKWLLREVTEESIDAVDSDTLLGLTEWMSVGGDTSIQEFSKLSREEREDIVDYLGEFSLYETVEVNGKQFVLVHAGLDHFSPERKLEDYDLSEMLFHSPKYDTVYYEEKYLVTGHLPTRAIFAAQQGLSAEEMEPLQFCDEIYEKNHHIAIDCGCGYDGRLGCICLDTMEKFYV